VSTNKKEKEPTTLSQSFARACGLLLIGIVALWLALELLAKIWGWLLLVAGTAVAIWIAIAIIRWRRSRW